MRRRDRVFTGFVQNVSLNPPPGKTEFFVDNMVQDGVGSYFRGMNRFQEEVWKSPSKLGKFTAMGAVVGVLLTMFHQHRRLVNMAVLLALVGYPIAESVKSFAKMEEAYQAVQDGNPQVGRKDFKKALDNLVYQVGHEYLKPLFIGTFILAPILSLPRIVKRPQWWFEKAVDRVLKTIKITPETAWINKYDRYVTTPLLNTGEKVLEKGQKIPGLGWLVKKL